MEILKIVGLCLSSFSLGMSITGLIFSTLNYREAGMKLKRMEETDRRLKQMKEKEEKRDAGNQNDNPHGN